MLTLTYVLSGATTGGPTDVAVTPLPSPPYLPHHFESEGANGNSFNIGSTDVLYTITDAAGNAATCTFEVIVRDREAPDFHCPADVTVECTAPAAYADQCG